jgi:hypothetical protein
VNVPYGQFHGSHPGHIRSYRPHAQILNLEGVWGVLLEFFRILTWLRLVVSERFYNENTIRLNHARALACVRVRGREGVGCAGGPLHGSTGNERYWARLPLLPRPSSPARCHSVRFRPIDKMSPDSVHSAATAYRAAELRIRISHADY